MKLISLLLIMTFSAQAHLEGFSGDIDHKGHQDPREFILDERLRPSKTEVYESSEAETKVIIKLLKDGVERELQNVDIEINCGRSQGSLELSNKYFRIKNRSYYYIRETIECGKVNVWNFDVKSPAGEAIGIFEQVNIAIHKFNELDLLGFWKRQIVFRWPSNGDYYSWGTVHITKGYQWDVVGHELGHAIYDQANIGAFGGGSHRIDECYTGALALSEGWASFFSAWLNHKLDDSDARFEYLVPRRAPIRFENIPQDVCKGQTNEWRVTGFFWDLIDTHQDNEDANMDFKKLWNLKLNKNFSDTRDLARDLETAMDPILLRAVWKNNFLTDY